MLISVALDDGLEQIEVPDEEVICFPHGIFGFEECTRFVLFELEPPLYLLQSVDDPHTGFVTIDPFVVEDSYRVPAREECSVLELGEDDGRSLLCVATLAADGIPLSVNLRAPVVINASKKLGMQLILQEELSVRHPLRVSPDGEVLSYSKAVSKNSLYDSSVTTGAGRQEC